MAIQNDVKLWPKLWPKLQKGSSYNTKVAITFVGDEKHLFMHHHSPRMWCESLKEHLQYYDFGTYDVDYFDDYVSVTHICYMGYGINREEPDADIT